MIADEQLDELIAWLAAAGLAGQPELALLTGFCERAVPAGLRIARAHVLIDTLDPVHEGRVFRAGLRPHQPSGGVRNARLGFSAGRAAYRRMARQPVLPDAGNRRIAVAAPPLRGGQSVALTRMTATLMQTYLGRDAGRRVLSGRIMRGIADRLDTVLWFSDLRGFTRITDMTPEHVIPLLNDYADVVVSAIHEQGGDVLKLIGDGILAIFTADDRNRACNAALSRPWPRAGASPS